MQCNHNMLRFGSGEYYIFCVDCSKKWVLHADDRPEYGENEAGQKIGATPELSDGRARMGLRAQLQPEAEPYLIGCVCPPGANKECKNPICPRKNPSADAAQ